MTLNSAEITPDKSLSVMIAQRIREERERLGLSQVEFSQMAHIKRSTQIYYEAGTRYPGTKYFECLEQSGIDVTYLLTGQRSLTTYNEKEWLHFKSDALWDAFSAAIKITNPSASSDSIAASLAAFKALCLVCYDQSDPLIVEDFVSRMRNGMIDSPLNF